MLTNLLRAFSIRLRMVGAIAMVLVLLGMVGATGFLGLNRVLANGGEFSSVVFRDAETLSALRQELGNLRRYEKDVALSVEAGAEAGSYLSRWQESVSNARKQAGALAATGYATAQPVAREIDQRIGAYAASAQPVLAKAATGGFATPAEVNRALGDAKKEIRVVEEATGRLHVLLHAAAEKFIDAQHAAGDMSLAWFGVALAISILLVVPLTLANMVSICRPIDEATSIAERIAQGDLTTTDLDLRGNDEAARLLRSLQAMQESLRHLVGQVRHATDNINNASSEIAAGNQDLSSRTEQAAASLEQTAGAVEELTATVQESAESARQANQLATAASAIATRGGEVVREVVTTMDDINASSKRIHDIVGVIDSIAFQTNILALNAAVEAARAGEQGRGFAVVASEVRSLAGRSAEAAREIKGLIGASVERVDAGSRLVHSAGGTMQEIVAGVQRVSDMMGEIAAAAGEQSKGISQVNSAVNHLDQMTQQNAALVEQSAAAAQSMKDQAQRLAQVLATFQTGEGSPAPALELTPLQPARARPAPKKPALPNRRSPVRLAASPPPRLPAGRGSGR
jgi:methyl-accepting chemotaxis protein